MPEPLGWCSHLCHSLMDLGVDRCVWWRAWNTWQKKFTCHILQLFPLNSCKTSSRPLLPSLQSLKALCRAQWAGRCTVQQLPVGGPQLVSHAANTHLNMSRWSPARSPHQPGANYFSGGVQPGPRLGSFPFSLRLFLFPHYHHFYSGVLPERQFTLIWQGRQMPGTVARMCRVTRASWGASVAF